MTAPKHDDLDEFGRRAGALLREGEDTLDGATASRLNRARQAALGARSAGRWAGGGWVPALSAAAVGALAVGLWLARENGPPAPSLPPAGAAESAADLELLLAGDNLEMLEDLEFYTWLDADRSDAELGAELEAAG